MSSNILVVPQGLVDYSSSITLASLANNAGRVGAIIDNSTTKARRALLYLILKTGTAPTAGTTYDVYLCRFDTGSAGTLTYGSDGAAGTDAAFTPNDAVPLGSLKLSASPNTLFYLDVDTADFTNDLGPGFAFAVFNNGTSQALNASGHLIKYNLLIDQAQ